jgi:two-component system, NtrC family, sensor kinase
MVVAPLLRRATPQIDQALSLLNFIKPSHSLLIQLMSGSSNTDNTEKNATLLVVDDDVVTNNRLRKVFEADGYRVITVENAPSALQLIHKEACDVIMLDVEMPGISGLALCRLLRAQPTSKNTPILMLSGRDEESSKIEAFTAGADDYIIKPCSSGELLSRVKAQLEHSRIKNELIDSNRELGFLADLGRGLLCALEPEQVMRRVAGETYEGLQAELSAAIICSQYGDEAVCLFDREGNAVGANHIHMDRLRAWLGSSASSTSSVIKKKRQFFLKDKQHVVEYIAPLRFAGNSIGAIVVAFDSLEDCSARESRLVDAAAQLASLSAHISTLYAASRQASANLAREVELRTAEAKAQQRFTEAIIDSLPVSLHVVDRNYKIVAWNRNRELGGQGIPRRDAIGRNIFDVLTRQLRAITEREFAHVFATGEIVTVEQEAIGQNGETQYWLINKIPMYTDGDEVTHVITVGEDVTARVHANRAVTRSERLASVGRLAAGIVHEINNPLATISACAEALESRLDEGDIAVEDLREYLGLIRSEAFRCKSITNGLLDFSRTRAGQPMPINVSNLVASVAKLVNHQRRGKNIEIRVETSENIPEVMGDEGQLQQAIIALAVNGIDAMPNGGTLTLAARDQGNSVSIEVKDTGIGIPLENITRIFDPFFTTKEVGCGTGLGLSVCYGIVGEHGGRISVDSFIGSGTTFTIILPIPNKEERK